MAGTKQILSGKDLHGRRVSIGDEFCYNAETAKCTGFTEDGKIIGKTNAPMLPGGTSKAEVVLPVAEVVKWTPPGS